MSPEAGRGSWAHLSCLLLSKQESKALETSECDLNDLAFKNVTLSNVFSIRKDILLPLF